MTGHVIAGRVRGRSAGGRARGDERGAVAVEAVMVIPVLVLVLGVLVAGWRLWSARTQVADAAGAAARAATLESSGTAARERALAVARTDLEVLGVHCEPLGVEVDTSGFASSPGEPARVRVDVTCTVGLADLVAPGLPGHWQATATASQPLDTFRERRP